MALRTISICAGVGGLDLGVRIARPDARCVAYVEGYMSRNADNVRRWRERNPEAAKQGRRDYHAANAAVIREKKRQYYQTVRKAKDATPEGRLRDRNRKAFRRTASGEGVTFDQWQEILNRHQHRCAYCGATGALEMDHVIALTKGGEHSASNIVPACKPCNSRKGNR